jgi:hypothetical protein
MKITEDHGTADYDLHELCADLLPENYLWMHVIERFLKDLAGLSQVCWEMEQARALWEWDLHPDHFHDLVFDRTGLSQGAAEWVWEQIQYAVSVARMNERNDPLKLKNKTKKLLNSRKDTC